MPLVGGRVLFTSTIFYRYLVFRERRRRHGGDGGGYGSLSRASSHCGLEGYCRATVQNVKYTKAPIPRGAYIGGLRKIAEKLQEIDINFLGLRKIAVNLALLCTVPEVKDKMSNV